MRYRFTARKTPVRWDHYRRATFVSLCLGTGLLILFALSGGADLFNYDWLIDGIACTGMAGHLLASSTYIGRALDLVDKDFKKLTRNEWIEAVLTCPFILAGLGIGVLLSVLQPITTTFFGILNTLIFIMRAIGAYAGIGNRLGSLVRRNPTEKKALILFTCLGLGVGILLFCTGGMPALCVSGISTVITSSTIAKFFAIGYIMSSYASAADYASKAYCFYRSVANGKLDENDVTPDGQEGENTQIRKRFCEYAGSFILALVGWIVAMIVLPYVGSFWAGTTVVISCISIFGGVGSRVGRLLDAGYELLEEVKANSGIAEAVIAQPTTENTDQSPTSSLAPMPLPLDFHAVVTAPPSISPSPVYRSARLPALAHSASCPDLTTLRDKESAKALIVERKRRNSVIANTPAPSGHTLRSA